MPSSRRASEAGTLPKTAVRGSAERSAEAGLSRGSAFAAALPLALASGFFAAGVRGAARRARPGAEPAPAASGSSITVIFGLSPTPYATARRFAGSPESSCPSLRYASAP